MGEEDKAVNSEDGQTLRKELTKHVQHIRVCTLSFEGFGREVVPTKILTDAEIAQVCMCIANKELKPNLKEICDVVEPRNKSFKKSEIQEVTIPIDLRFKQKQSESTFEIHTKSKHLELSSLVVFQQGSYNQCDFSIIIEKMGTASEQITYERPNQVSSNREFVISFEDENLLLLPDSKYKITLRSNHPHCLYYLINPVEIVNYIDDDEDDEYTKFQGENLTVFYQSMYSDFVTGVKTIKYKTLKLR